MKKKMSLYVSVIAMLAFFGFANVATVNGQTWTSVDGNGTNGINSTTATQSLNPVCAVYNDTLYAIWYESYAASQNQVHIKKYTSGTTWVGAGNVAGQSQLNISTYPATDPKLVVYNGNLYAAWEENGDVVGAIGDGSIHVKQFNGTSWTFVQNYPYSSTRIDSRTGQPYPDINYQPTSNASNVDLFVYNNELYATWVEDANITGIQQVRVSKFNGTLWNCVDGNSTYGLNYNYNYNASAPKLCVYNNNLYVSWTEDNATGTSPLRVKKYNNDGSTWTFVDGGAATGLNYSSAIGAEMQTMCAYNGLYALWSAPDYNNPDWGPTSQVRVKKYNGTSWAFADGGLSTGWNKDIVAGSNALDPAAMVYNNLMYAAWDENDTASPWSSQIRVVRYDGTTKTFIDGNQSNGINKDYTKDAETPALTTYHGDLYTFWAEDRDGSDGTYQIRAKKYPLPGIVTSVSVPSNSTYKAGQNLDFTVTVNKNETVTGTPYIPITLNSGGTVNATYLSGSGTSALLFRYTVASGNADPDGITVGSSIVLNGGTIQDASSIAASLTLNSVGVTTGVLVDAVAPTVSSINRQTPTTTLTNASSVVYRVTFSESVTGVGTSSFTLTKTGTANGAIASVSAASGTTIDVTVNSVSGDGTLRLDLNSTGTGIADAAGNAISGGFTSGQMYTIDKTAPTVISINRQTPTDSLVSATSVVYRVTFSEPVVGISTSAFSLTSTATGSIASVSASFGSYIDVTVNSISGNGTLRLDLKSTGTGIADSAGNPISGGFTNGQLYAITTLPTVKTMSTTNILATTATGNGNLTGLGASAISSYGICWSTTANPDTATVNKVKNGTTSSTGPFNVSMTGLTPNTLYHVRAFAGNSNGITYGEDLTFTTPQVYTVTYNGNTSNGGSVPVDGNTYLANATVTVLGNTGSLVKTGYTFTGWNTAADSSGTSYSAGSTFTMGTSNVILYAKWAIKKYTITMTATNGSVGYSPNNTLFDTNTTVQLTATPTSGYHFTGWSGDITGTTNPGSVVMNSNKSITANFAINTYQLTVAASAGGTISAPTATISNVNYGAPTTITAAAQPGYTFVNWTRSNANATIATPSALSTTVTLTDSATVTAVFSLNAYTLSITAANGSVTKNPDQSSYNYGTLVQLTAVPNTGYSFTSWSDSSTWTTSSASITMNSNKTVTANFSLIPFNIVYNLNGGTNGSNPATYNVTTSTITLAAPTKPGFVFGGWYAASDFSGSAVTTIAQGSTGDKTLYAKWTIKQYTITMTATNGTVGYLPNTASFDSNTTVQMTATPNTGYHFTGWSGDITGTTNPGSVVMNSNKTITATFAINTYQLTVATTAGGTISAPATPVSTVNYGVQTTITAVAQPGYTFVNWTRSSTNATLDSTLISTSVTLTGADTVTANFTLNLPTTPTQLLPINAFTTIDTSITFTWNKASVGIDHYRLVVASDPTMSIIVVNDSTLNDTTSIRVLTSRIKYWWQVRAHNASGWGSLSAKDSFTIEQSTAVKPLKYAMQLTGFKGNASTIKYAIPDASYVSIRLFDVQGKMIKELFNGFQSAGFYQINADASALSSGLYVLKFKAGTHEVIKRFTAIP